MLAAQDDQCSSENGEDCALNALQFLGRRQEQDRWRDGRWRPLMWGRASEGFVRAALAPRRSCVTTGWTRSAKLVLRPLRSSLPPHARCPFPPCTWPPCHLPGARESGSPGCPLWSFDPASPESKINTCPIRPQALERPELRIDAWHFSRCFSKARRKSPPPSAMAMWHSAVLQGTPGAESRTA